MAIAMLKRRIAFLCSGAPKRNGCVFRQSVTPGVPLTRSRHCRPNGPAFYLLGRGRFPVWANSPVVPYPRGRILIPPGMAGVPPSPPQIRTRGSFPHPVFRTREISVQLCAVDDPARWQRMTGENALKYPILAAILAFDVPPLSPAFTTWWAICPVSPMFPVASVGM